MAELTGRTLVRNTLYANAGQVWRIGSRIVLTPMILARIGLAGYGIWGLLFGLTEYVTVLNTSFGTAYGKLTAEYDRQGRYDELSEALGAGMVAIGSAGALGLMGLYALAPMVLPYIGVPEEMVAESVSAFFVVCLAVVVDMSAGCALQVLHGLQRMDLRIRLNILASMLDFVVAIVLLQLGYGLQALAYAYLAGRLLAVSAAWLVCRRVCPQLRLSPLHATREGLRAVFSLGARFQGLALLNTFAGQGLRMLISALAGVSMLGAFRLGGRLLGLARTPGASLIGPLLPAFAHLEAGADRARFEALFFRASKSLAAASLVALAFVAIFAEPLLFAWTARHVPEAVLTVQITAVASLVSLLTGVGTAALRASGRVRLEFQYGLVGTVLAFLAVGLGYPLAGFAGMLAALAIARIASASFFLAGLSQTGLVDMRQYLLSSVVRPMALLAPVLLLVLGASRALPVLELAANDRWMSLGGVAVWGALCTLLCAPVIWFGILDEDERRSFASLLPRRASAT